MTASASTDHPVDDPVQKALAVDIGMLDDLLASTLHRLAGPKAIALVEDVRSSTRILRLEPSVDEARRLRDRLAKLDLPSLRLLIRACSIYFDLANLAEQQARVRAIRQRSIRLAPQPMPESPEAALIELRQQGVRDDQLAELLDRALVCPVFTAHPSEARRLTVLEKLTAIARRLDDLEYRRLLPRERDEAVAAIAEEVEAFWLTDIVRSRRPAVLDEVRQGVQMVENSLLEVVPRTYRDLEAALRRVYPERAWRVPSFLRFGSWIGGDRDGNTRVTHEITAKAVRRHQETALHCYLHRLNDLARHLSHSENFFQPEAAFRTALDADAAALPEVPRSANPEPYRAKCRFIQAKLTRTLEHVRTVRPKWGAEEAGPASGGYAGRQELLADLCSLAEDLRRTGAEAAAAGTVQDLVRAVEVFGTHLLTLDIRQHSARHAQALDEILAWAGVAPRYLKLTPNERFDCLVAVLQEARPLIPAHLPFSDDTREVVQTFRTVAAILEQQCAEAIDTYVISGASEPAHVLEVLLLAREAGLFRPADGVSRLNIVPLFEALEPLRQAAVIVQRLLSLPVYRQHLQLRGNVQEVMIGYSDSNKESGFLQSAWSLYRTQRDLADCGRRAGLTVQMFHGRGGAIGRGGGPANQAILAQPLGTVAGRLRLTEQGEMIADRYGHRAIAERHLGQVLNAVLRTSFPGKTEGPEPTWERALERLAASACRHYRALVYETPEFLTYFEQATPVAEIGRLKIGSRPSRRGGGAGIEELRAIPWGFSWMQSRHTLPGWYGLGSAVEEYLADHGGTLSELQDMYRRWPFWRTLIDNAQMILAKADITIARLYADLVEDAALAERIFGRIAGEYQKSVNVILRITQQQVLLEHAPVLRNSIARRNPDVDPLSFVQLVLLQRLRHEPEPSEALLTAVLESINGVASGLKNTG